MRLKTLLLGISLLASCAAVMAQRTIPPTDAFSVTGKVKNPLVFTLAALDTFPKTEINRQVIYNHNGEVKDTLTGLVGVPLKTLLASVEYVYEKPKNLNEFYFVFIASDGYKVVFSWNEIYNTEAGDHFFILTGMKGVQLRELKQRIAFLSTADLKAGRRYIKGLERIEVRQVE